MSYSELLPDCEGIYVGLTFTIAVNSFSAFLDGVELESKLSDTLFFFTGAE